MKKSKEARFQTQLHTIEAIEFSFFISASSPTDDDKHE
jgi:hypothetical protein